MSPAAGMLHSKAPAGGWVGFLHSRCESRAHTGNQSRMAEASAEARGHGSPLPSVLANAAESLRALQTASHLG